MAKAKGASLIAVVKWLRHERTASQRLLPAHLQHYLDERVLVSSWYPEEDLLELIRALARILPLGGGDVYEQIGRFGAREQLAGLYRHLLEGGDELSLPRRGLVLWQTQHDSGRLSMAIEGPGAARLEIADYALPSREMCGILLGYTAEMFAMAELKEPSVRKQSCRLDGAGLCSWRCAWTPAQLSAPVSSR